MLHNIDNVPIGIADRGLCRIEKLSAKGEYYVNTKNDVLIKITEDEKLKYINKRFITFDISFK